MNLHQFENWTNTLHQIDTPMPALFIGHGSPMNAIETNEFTQSWQLLGQKIPTPQAILVISAHWLTKKTHITAMENPKTIHDFGGFPQALFDVQYSAKGNTTLAQEIQQISQPNHIFLNETWGLDHGTWSILAQMYPQATIPVLQLSIDYDKPAAYHFELAQKLKNLRQKGVLIIGSGNMIHNLKLLAWDKMQVPNYGYDWAQEMNHILKEKILTNDFKALLNYSNLGHASTLAIPTPDHYLPLIYSVALQKPTDEVHFFNDQLVAGSLSMTSVIWK
ncbi:4,5-DOPA dioxygenase extradiol [Flavobacterium branchiophilum NBRC 15030 = ATCC 35035]|uniref:4,5-DOPA dioxygenase extradiol n=1 Tax=Flavobacterium branchiophilum TaxID=55197 RepID=A0A543G615_9FLAO|nr:4,5-DOPA dioxygenase extradiol [Flavobacterium branchiophilum]OXA81107.1 4,5-DOPA dioxygenase extradiol [Flavobacterium branchiophilum NBRC 15030 = ATCC 35035]TQM41530.1 4,5-DOPA dioxygenase extradiol [Flavobacterium branchiophilum]GEM55112.1 dioxygenase [Flavobacterium branchiophilum NBRC 15030 = ATCC 35035]